MKTVNTRFFSAPDRKCNGDFSPAESLADLGWVARESFCTARGVYMLAAFPIYPAHTALLSMDCQTGVVSLYLKGDKDAFLTRASNAIHHARSKGMLVLHVQVGFRPGLPEVSSRNLLLGAIKSSPQHQKLFQEPLGSIPPAIAPKESEVVITKHRISAFAGTDLAMILRANDIDTLVLFGIATSGVVLSTLLDAFDDDFRLAVIKDCCADLDSNLHDCLINRFFPSRAAVLTAREFAETS
jgi:nicotinamidase-related amidase